MFRDLLVTFLLFLFTKRNTTNNVKTSHMLLYHRSPVNAELPYFGRSYAPPSPPLYWLVLRWVCLSDLCKLCLQTAHWRNAILSSVLLDGWLWTLFCWKFILVLLEPFFCFLEGFMPRRRVTYPRSERSLLAHTTPHIREEWRSLICSECSHYPTRCVPFNVLTLKKECGPTSQL